MMSNPNDTMTGKMPCPECSGDGDQVCPACRDDDVNVQSCMRCNTHGTIVCHTCKGDGEVDICDHTDCNGETMGRYFDRPQSSVDLVRCERHLPGEVIKARAWLKGVKIGIDGDDYGSAFDAAHDCAYDEGVDIIDSRRDNNLSIPGWLTDMAEEILGPDKETNE